MWENQVYHLLSHQHLLGYVIRSISEPPTTIVGEKNSVLPNPTHVVWLEVDKRVCLLLNSSLTEEAMTESLGH